MTQVHGRIVSGSAMSSFSGFPASFFQKVLFSLCLAYTHLVALSGGEQVALGVVVRALLAGAALPQVEGEGEQRPGHRQAADAGHGLLQFKKAEGIRDKVCFWCVTVGTSSRVNQ